MTKEQDLRNLQLREASGHVVDKRPVVSLLYELLRDHLPAATVEQLVTNSERQGETKYTNGFLAQYAKYLANRLEGKTGG